jgi:hypothetical protein
MAALHVALSGGHADRVQGVHVLGRVHLVEVFHGDLDRFLLQQVLDRAGVEAGVVADVRQKRRAADEVAAEYMPAPASFVR